MKIAIMQPTYIPWVGYFAMMKSVDKFVFLDHVQFARRSWQQRNRIVMNGTEHLLSLSVEKSCRDTALKDIKLSGGNGDFDKHLKTIYQAYCNAPYFENYFKYIEQIGKSKNKLSDLNISLICYIKEQLNIDTEVVLSSNLRVEGAKSELMYNICKNENASVYLSAPGSKEYMESGSGFNFSDIKVEYFNYKPNEYSQNSNQFIPYMSVLDLLFNEGKESFKFL